MINQLIRPEIKNLPDINWGNVPDSSPYRLLWGENQQINPICKKAIKDEIKNINFYPSPTKEKLKEAIAKYNKIESENIIITNGSDDAIELIAKVLLEKNDEVIVPIPTFPVYMSASSIMGAKIKKFMLEKDFSLDLKKLIQTITPKTKIIWIANPNNPTGNMLLNEKQIQELAEKNNCIIVIDECYFGISQITALPLIKKYPNIIVIRSFSKTFSLAGLRLGYLMTNSDLTIYLNRLQQASEVFSVNRFAQAAGTTLLNNAVEVANSLKKFVQLKNNFEKVLKKIPGLEIIPTQTTFSLIKLSPKITAKNLKEKLQEKNIYIKDCSIYENLGEQYAYLGIPPKKYQKKLLTEIKNALIC